MEKKYLEELLSQIREKRAREKVYREVKGHLEDQKEVYLAEGMSEEEAEKKAVADMGDPLEAGTALDLIHRPKPAWGMLAVIGLLCTVGMLLQYTLLLHTESNAYYFKNQCQHVVIGLVLLVIVYLIDYTRIAKYSRRVCIFLLLLVYAGRYFGETNVLGAMLFLFGTSVSLSAFLYLYVPFYGAILYTYRNDGKRQWKKIAAYSVIPVILAYCMPNIIQAINLNLIFAVLLSTAVLKGWYGHSKKKMLAVIWGIAMGIPALLVLLFSSTGAAYRSARIKAWLMQASLNGDSYVYGMIRKILNTSHLVGAKSGEQIFGYLPEISTDYLLTYLTGAYGVLAAVGLILAILLLGTHFLHISIRQKNQLGMIMGIGCSLVFGLQAVEYILMNFGLIPATRVYLPLISYGGSGMMQTCILLGLLLSIYRYQDIAAEPVG